MDAWKRALTGVVACAALWSGAGLAPAAAAGGGVDLLLGTKQVLDEATVAQASEGAARLCGGTPSSYAKKARKAAATGSIVVLCTRPGGKQVYFR
ncbi:hypothetical protein [uncultured Kocuria sp.]|uniref:hypothetical protein n=1 Tax=uncultured Kocuria sp. TaxID=259305 RepID=UPI0026287CB2|nr:hypothetical protein [uncultured Kocuria sp.]